MVANLATGIEREILGYTGLGRDWSSTGAKITFRHGDSIATVNPDGSAATDIVVGPVKSKTTTKRYHQPRFSPDGQLIAFSEINDVGFAARSDFAVDRVATAGGSVVPLTPELNRSSRMLVLGWRGKTEAIP